MDSSSKEGEMVKNSLSLIENAWSGISSEISQNPKTDLIFLLGKTGAGKSTITEILTNDLKTLCSIPLSHGKGMVIVDETCRIGEPQVASKTFLPEIRICHDDSSLLFLDTPGFGENRGADMDIATMALIKKTADQVNNVKIVIVVPASSVSYSDLNRNEFSQLCTHVTSFIKNLEKFESSIGLVINKASNFDPSSGKKLEDVSIKNEVSKFLKDVAEQNAISDENKQLISYLLKDDTKWAIVRLPNEEGPLSETMFFPEARNNMIHICKHQLEWAHTTSDDFAVTLSPESKNIVRSKLIPYLTGEVDRIVVNLLNSILSKFENSTRALMETKNSSIVAVVNNLATIREKCKQWEDGNCWLILTPSKKVNRLVDIYDVVLAKDDVDNLQKLEDELTLFRAITDEELTEQKASFDVINAINQLKSNLELLSNEALKIAKENMHMLESKIKDINLVFSSDAKRIYQLNISKLLEIQDFGKQAIEKLHSDRQMLENLDNQGTFTNTLSGTVTNILHNLQLEHNTELMTELLEKENALELLSKLIYENDSLSISGAQDFILEVRKGVSITRTKTYQYVKETHIVNVHKEIKQKVKCLIENASSSFLNNSLYADLSISTLSQKRQMLETLHQQLKLSIDRVSQITETVIQAIRILEQEFPEDENLLDELEKLLDFYDEMLENYSTPRPINDWMECVRSLEENLGRRSTLFGFLDNCKNSDFTVVPALEVMVDGSSESVESFLEAFHANQETKSIVEKIAGPNEKSLINEIARYITCAKTKIVALFPEKVIVKGKHVKLSSVLHLMHQESDDFPKKLLVEAEDSVEFDSNLDSKGRGMDVTVIAPKWIFKGSKINLSGQDATPLTDKSAASGRDFGESGQDGVDGNSGGNGGNFFGVYKEVINGKAFSIKSHGGNGGDGQDGGEGFIGRDPEEINNHVPVPVLNGDKISMGITIAASAMFLISDYVRSRSRKGFSGGNGGKGGDSGFPGAAGLVKLINVEGGNNTFGTISCLNGCPGKPGQGKQGARGGRGHSRGQNGSNGTQKAVKVINEKKCFPQSDLKEYRRFITEEITYSQTGKEFLQLLYDHPDIHLH